MQDNASVAVVIYVDGVAAMGTGAGSAGSRLCDTTGLASHSRTALAVVGPGSHNVTVTGQVLGSGTGKLFRSITVVEN